MAGKKKAPVKKKPTRGSGTRTAAKKREAKKARVARKQPAPKPDEPVMGRPTDYRPEYAEAAYRYCLLGDTDADLAGRFGVVESTINEWKHKHSDFSESIARGKAAADAEVAHGLFKRATGAEWEEGVAFKVKTVIYDPKTGRKVREEEDIRVATVQKAAPPDTNAAKHWLNNRRPDRWKEKIEVETKNTPLSDRIKNARKRLKEEGYKHV